MLFANVTPVGAGVGAGAKVTALTVSAGGGTLRRAASGGTRTGADSMVYPGVGSARVLAVPWMW